jgi:Dullard-like phosphatase family protein
MLEVFSLSPLSEPDPMISPPNKSKNSSRVSIILDLDNTLLNSSTMAPSTYDFTFDFIDLDRSVKVYTTLRPFLQEFLNELQSFSDLYLFTAGTSDYAHQIVRYIDPFGVIFRGVFTRDDCTMVGFSRFIKHYEKCGTNMERTLIVDDNPLYFKKWKQNGVAIQPFVGQRNDVELFRVLYEIQARCRAMDLLC